MDVRKDSREESESYHSGNSIVSQKSFRTPSYKLKPRYYFGISNIGTKDLQFIDDVTVIHLVGRLIVIDNLEEKTQQFINLKEIRSVINIVALSPNKKYLAVSELREDGPIISIYNMLRNKHTKTLRLPVNSCSGMSFQCLTYTCNSTYLIAIIPEPDWKIVFYNIKSGNINCIINEIGKRIKGTMVLQVCCHPNDPKQLMVLGLDFYQMLKFKNRHWVPYGHQGNLSIKITGGCWVTPIISVIGTYDGRLIFLEYGHIQGIYDALTTEEIDLGIEDVDSSILDNLSDFDKSTAFERVYDNEVKAMVGFENGFAFSCKAGEVIIFMAYPEFEHKLKWRKIGVYRAVTPAIGFMDSPFYDTVQQICVSPDLNMIACTTLRQEIYYGSMMEDFPNPEMSYVCFQKLYGDLHQGPVSSVSVARWKPLYITIGSEDHSGILWNYKLNQMIFRRVFPDDVRSASLHPTGIFCLLGFSDRIKLAMIYHMGFKYVRETPVRYCSKVAFSQGGHLFAAVCGVTICIYCAFSFTRNYVFRGHDGPVNCLYFAYHDYHLYSCSMEGSFFMWDVDDGTRVDELYTRGNATVGIAFIEQDFLIYLVGTDGCLRELLCGYPNRTFDFKLGSMYCVSFVNSGATLVVSGEEGIIIATGHPIFSPIKFRQYTVHTAPVRELMIAPEEDIMMSISDDGSICLWDLIPPESLFPPSPIKSPTISIEEVESEESFSFIEKPKIEILEEYMTYVVIDETKWTQENEEIDELKITLIETNIANEFIIKKTQASFDMQLKQPDTNYIKEVAQLQMQIKIMDRDATIKLYEWQDKLANMTVEDDFFESHFTMRKYMLIERSDRIMKTCKANLKQFLNNISKALKEFTRCKTKAIVRAIDHNQFLEYKYSRALARCRGEYSKFESMRDDDEYYIRREINSEINSIYEWNLSFQNKSNLLVAGASRSQYKVFGLVDQFVYWLRACREIKEVHTKLYQETDYLRAEDKSLKMELRRLVPIKKFAASTNRSYLIQANVLKMLVTDVITILEPLYAICRNRMLKCARLEERFNDRNRVLTNIRKRYFKFKKDHYRIRKAMIRSWKRSSSMAKVFTNLENETLIRAIYGYSPKALKSIFKVISKVYNKRIEKPEYNQGLRKLEEIKRHKIFLKKIIRMFKKSVKGQFRTQHNFIYAPATTEDVSKLFYYTNRYKACLKTVTKKLKSLRNAAKLPGKTFDEAKKVFATKTDKLRSHILSKREDIKHYHATRHLINREIYRWRHVLERSLNRWMNDCKNDLIIRKYARSRSSVSQTTQQTCEVMSH